MIEKCAFGSMVINGRVYTSDLKILPDGNIMHEWRRAHGHKLLLEDIADLVALHPEVIIAGTGIYGLVKPAMDLHDHLAQEGIELILARTKKAAEFFNAARNKPQRVAGCFHLTC